MAVKQAKAAASTGPPAGGRRGAFRRIAQFFIDAWLELNKVAWPTFPEVRRFTLVVMFAVLMVALFIYVCDQVLTILTRPLFAH